jgi:DNA-binding GntR family transcriptional regulator
MTNPAGGAFATRYESIRDQIISEIGAGVYPAGALLPSIREIMQRWEVSTTTARRVLDELAAAGYARKEGTRGHISTGGPSSGQLPAATVQARPTTTTAPPTGRLTVRPAHTVPANGGIEPDSDTEIAALDVRVEPAPPDAAIALRLADPVGSVIVRRRLLAARDGTPVQIRTSYLPLAHADGTPLAAPEPISEPWPTALATHISGRPQLAASYITARHPTHDEAPALALPTDAAVLVRDDIHHDGQGTPVDYTRTVWPGDTTRLAVIGG